MPEMMEIYKKHASNYDELVNAEDYNKNLDNFLQEKIYWNNKIVYEAGIGTGRVTKIYIDKINHVYGFDREQHMLKKCKENIHDFSNYSLDICENTELKMIPQKADIFIEGWSFGHTIIENMNNYESIFRKIYSNLTTIVKDKGEIILIESCGTNVNEAFNKTGILGDFYSHIEDKYNFKKYVISTDYKFLNYKEAARIMGFFFGNEMSDDIIKNEKNIIPEFTGIWIKESK